MSSAFALLHANLIEARAQGRRLPEVFAEIHGENKSAASDAIAAWPRILHRLAQDGALTPPPAERDWHRAS